MKSISLPNIEVSKLGILQINAHKLSSDGDLLGYHSITIAPGGDIDAQIAAINAHMGSEGYAPIPDADVARVKATAAATWTPENIAPVTAQVVEAIAVQQAAITEAAAKKAEAEAAANKEIEDAKAREVAANEAKALAEAAEAAAKEAKEKCEAECAALAKAEAELAAMKQAKQKQIEYDLRVAEAAENALAEKAAFDKAVADAVAKLAPVEAVA